MNNIEVDFQKVESVVTNDVVHIKYNDQDYTINESKIRRKRSVRIDNFDFSNEELSYTPIMNGEKKYYIYNTKKSLRIHRIIDLYSHPFTSDLFPIW